MELLRCSWRELARFSGRWAVTLGSFDGVHRGHHAILEHCREIAALDEHEGSVAVSFTRHPRSVLKGQRSPRLLTTLAERVALLAECGIDRLLLLPFDDELASMDHADFVREILIARLGMGHFVLGHDVHFGRDRGGNVQSVGELAEREGFSFSQVASIRAEGSPISSSRIRDLLAGGRLADAEQLLGHPYLLEGLVERGRGLGRQLGFPTANLSTPPPGKLLPPTGVYAAYAQLESEWTPAILNIGRAPTVESGGPMRVEAHLLGPHGDLYGLRMALALGPCLREERRFAGLEELKSQIERDLEQAKSWHRSGSPPSSSLQVTAWQAVMDEGQT